MGGDRLVVVIAFLFCKKMALVSLLLVCILASSVYSFNTYSHPVYSRASSCLHGTNWDALIKEDEDDDLQFNGPPVARDMKYNMFSK